MNHRQSINVIGLGIGPGHLHPEQETVLAQAQVVAGGQEILNRLQDHPGEKIVISSPLKDIFRQIKSKQAQGKSIAILCSGDPLFFGLGATLLKHFPPKDLMFHPNLTTLQAAAAKAKLSWSQIRVISLHGRTNPLPLFSALRKERYIGIYTDHFYTPQHLAQILTDLEANCFAITVFSDLGLPSEQVTIGQAEEIAKQQFSPLNFVLLSKQQGPKIPPKLGLNDNHLVHQQGLITKQEVRAMSLAALEISPKDIVWDLGAGSGAMSIEAACLADQGLVIAVEKNPSRIKDIEQNRKNTHSFNIRIVQGTIPGCLSDLPQPDRVFIGGGLSKDRNKASTCLKTIAQRIRRPGIIVTNLILLNSLQHCLSFCTTHGLEFELIQVQVSRASPLLQDKYLKALNPIFVLKIGVS